jgi:hypothetical protein
VCAIARATERMEEGSGSLRECMNDDITLVSEQIKRRKDDTITFDSMQLYDQETVLMHDAYLLVTVTWVMECVI